MNRETTNLKKEEIVRKWYVVDAANKPLGRLASEVATHLMLLTVKKYQLVVTTL